MILPNKKIISEQKHTELISKGRDKIEYLNKDGSKTIYLYSSPILTDNGEEIDLSLIKNIENKRIEQGFNYVTKENNIKTYFSDNPCEKGFLITNGKIEMQVYIESDNKSNDILFICSAGKNGNDLEKIPVYPACYDLPNIISVAAIDNTGKIYNKSGYGKKRMLQHRALIFIV